MPKYEVARNDVTTLYEVHKAGCKHLTGRHMTKSGGPPYEAETAQEVAAEVEAKNDGFVAVLGACVR